MVWSARSSNRSRSDSSGMAALISASRVMDVRGELAGDRRVVQRDVERLLLGLLEVDHDDLGLGLSQLLQHLQPLVAADHAASAPVPDNGLDQPEPLDAAAQTSQSLGRDRPAGCRVPA